MILRAAFLLCCMLGPLAYLWAQSNANVQPAESKYLGTFRINAKSDGVKGTPFLFDNPPNGKIKLSGGKEYESIPFNILLEKNEVYIQTDGVDSDPLPVRNWETIVIPEDGNRLFRTEYLNGKPQVLEILFEKDGEKFVAQHAKTLIRPTQQRDGYTGPQYDTFRHDIKYFRIKGMQTVEIKVNTAGLKELAGSKYEDVRDYIKNEKLKPEDPKDMSKILSYIFGG